MIPRRPFSLSTSQKMASSSIAAESSNGYVRKKSVRPSQVLGIGSSLAKPKKYGVPGHEVELLRDLCRLPHVVAVEESDELGSRSFDRAVPDRPGPGVLEAEKLNTRLEGSEDIVDPFVVLRHAHDYVGGDGLPLRGADGNRDKRPFRVGHARYDRCHARHAGCLAREPEWSLMREPGHRD